MLVTICSNHPCSRRNKIHLPQEFVSAKDVTGGQMFIQHLIFFVKMKNIILICLEFSLIICHELSNSKDMHLCHTDTHIVLCRIVSRGITNFKSVNELKAQLNFSKSPEAFRQKLATSCASSLSFSSFQPDNKYCC